ncbi:nuclear transcription factor Y subunit A-10 [Ricinus communis]|uniref:nuclear transcription factor Y subunit A-10 n=1 Tax=Ricinus communis TaxID=3988 RepID=UPI00201A3E5A|nr:nuclear transcription factor Y subunit A-10 [Ricinus communis]XP_025013994.2 nuclear transcription factor Y subunit A-10 [Ricinus communis]XP_025013995.2 nuclear transcription factor Y subunit A-10 [Ricinus communis]
MAVKTLYFKEHEGTVHNPIGQLSSVPSMPWWSSFGPQSVYGEPYDLLKPSTMENPIGGDRVTAVKQVRRDTRQDLDKGNTIHFTVFRGDCKISSEGQKPPQTAISLQTALPEHRALIDLGFGQPVVDQCYGLYAAYGSQIPGRVMLPMNMTTDDDGPIFVNPKQYHGIIRRRKSRAKAELENRPIRKRKPYMHLSRHLHAMRRPRGTGGRFLNSGNGKGGAVAKKAYDVEISQPTGSHSSEVLQSDSGGTNGGGSNLSGSEVTSMYSKRDLDHFSINLLGPPVHSFSVMMDNGHSIVMPSKWVAAAEDCCNLKV